MRFNPAADTRPAFLKRESTMIETLGWIQQASYYIRSGFKNKPPLSGSLEHLRALINPTWLQAIEAEGAKSKGLDDIMELIRLESDSRGSLESDSNLMSSMIIK